jgi:glycine dehydrogenase subunit 2
MTEPLSFEKSRQAASPPRLPDADVTGHDPAQVLGPDQLRKTAPGLPQLSEPEIMRH